MEILENVNLTGIALIALHYEHFPICLPCEETKVIVLFRETSTVREVSSNLLPKSQSCLDLIIFCGHRGGRPQTTCTDNG